MGSSQKIVVVEVVVVEVAVVKQYAHAADVAVVERPITAFASWQCAVDDGGHVRFGNLIVVVVAVAETALADLFHAVEVIYVVGF